MEVLDPRESRWQTELGPHVARLKTGMSPTGPYTHGNVPHRAVEQMTGFTESYNLVLYEETRVAANSSTAARPEDSLQLVPPNVHDSDVDSLSSD